MKRRITFWKNTGHEALRGKTVELFKVSWDERFPGGWVRDEDGPYWGMYKLDTQEVRRLTRDPEEMGDISFDEEVEELDRLVMRDRSIIRIESYNEEGVDHLEAEDISITPEGLNLGEEE